ncbi:bromodomain and PHD finger-containing protein 3-like isoform X1 [Entelurus aequoreus]|uniref:bromodomain and PHD finger-containing protein 3-like isoform X1 n=1 Tax=Entelurus aequoreus TaxID=161455 RepID=UPI002B1DC55A|nr:bromodomain and PHD finger-containing protein 3-like isoform X1 [Entelurus aequoreus]XP_061913368.1 bromodomain and PHD finger-containing protein 3-like isoform X1 [Entelurus aequoreus]XP_061913375.1 bromodomain and PHD finger-containing protein 3-like isoform X1 [Entelurus aequoreus]XP_061913384.1 bromodomain and PHD finger-containing protein 3-like isoform X1 [Entelurus aequoreus]XP_061913391.1 bromodomain and PHD finger-containing protein 3-like isoform X1 [Entelurus aequoreus]
MRKPRRKGHLAAGSGEDARESVETPAGGGARQRSPSPYGLKASPSRETLSYAQAQKVVEVELDGRLHRISVLEPLVVVAEDEMTAQDISECNSNKENSEQPSPPVSALLAVSKAVMPRGRRKDSKCKTPFKSPPPSKNHCAGAPTPEKPKAMHNHSAALPEPSFRVVETFTPVEAPPLPTGYYRYIERSPEEQEAVAEYDMDEEDAAWLEMVNAGRTAEGCSALSPDTFELLVDRLEDEAYREARTRVPSQNAIDDDAFCCVCLDDECLNSNVILFCDACNLAVHQECYGVPYIPEGQWLCRCCLQSPQKPVDCVLCPNRGGAFKQTSDSRWAHVVCAIWIPEVCFANTVFLEPVEGVNNIPPARWKLTCYLCKQKGRGASIQCHKANCYTAFHVTCAQRAGLFMKIDPVRETGVNGTTFSVKKTAFCETHSPAGQDAASDEENEGRVVGSRGRAGRGRSAYTDGPATPKKGRKSEGDSKADKKKGKEAESTSSNAASPQVMVPEIPANRLNAVCKGLLFQKKNQFMHRLHSYWLLKRQCRNGVPLVRRLHSNVQSQRNVEQPEVDEKVSAAREALRYWQKLRHDLEKARLLVELIRKREKLKREQIKVHQAALEMQLTPMLLLLRSTLEQLQEKDTAQIFAAPVDTMEVPDYLEFISQPMDFSTMRSKLEGHAYRCVADLDADFHLMLSNCLLYNARDTVFHRAALRLRDLGAAVLRHAQRQAASTGLEADTGMHLAEWQQKREFYSCTWEDVDSVLDPDNRIHMSVEEQLKELLDKLDFVSSMRCSAARTRRMRLLRREITSIRHRQGQQHRYGLHNGRLREDSDEEEEEEEEDVKAENGLSFSDKEDLKPASPPTLEPTGPAPPPRLGDAPLEPPTLRPIAKQHPGPTSWKRLKLEARAAAEDIVCTTSPPNLHSEGSAVANGLPDPCTPTRPSTDGVGRRTSVLFKKAKNGAKLFRERDGALLNGKAAQDDSSSASPDTPSTTPTDTPQKAIGPPSLTDQRSAGRETSSEGERHRTPNKKCGLTNGFDKHKDDGEYSTCPVLHKETTAAPRRSLGKPALSKVPLLDMVNGDTDYTGNGSHAAEEETQLEPLDMVWAKCRGYPSYPALIIDPDMPEEGLLLNGVPIPVPPKDVLRLGEQRQEESSHRLYLVLFFDNKRTWQWLPRDKLTPLGADNTADKLRIMEGRKPSVRKSVQVAYDRAMIHQSRVSHSQGFVASNFL